MVGIVDSISDTIAVFKGFGTVSPTMTLAFGTSRGRRLQRLQVKAQKAFDEMEKARKEGSITKFQKHFKEYMKDYSREEAMEDKEIRAEEKVERVIEEDFSEAMYALKGETLMQKRVKAVLDTWMNYIKEQFAKLSYLEQGGRPWEGVGDIAKYSKTQCTQIIITSFRNMRPDVRTVIAQLKGLKAIGPKISEAKRDKAKQAYIEALQKQAEGYVKTLESSSNKVIEQLKMAFYVGLRLWSHIKTDLETLNKKGGYLDQVNTQGLPKKTTDADKKIVAKALEKMHEDLQKEAIGEQNTMQRGLRAA
ncbi:MAG: hypothetical protein KKE20_00865 [Nanoarchaeota archaeon]|nr:hypothetical protein [Nanoarchaeota archaeon]